MEHTFLTAFVTLFLIVDPIGNIPVFNEVLKDVPPKRRKIVIVRECFLAFLLMALFAMFGRSFMSTLGLTQPALTIGGALVLLIIALRILFPSQHHSVAGTIDGEPFLFPIAIPMLAGPSALATVMLLVDGAPTQILLWIGAIAAVMAVSVAVLSIGGAIEKILGKKVTAAFLRLMGLILVVIAVQMFLTGIQAFMTTL